MKISNKKTYIYETNILLPNNILSSATERTRSCENVRDDDVSSPTIHHVHACTAIVCFCIF
jgi:hypothetical protein